MRKELTKEQVYTYISKRLSRQRINGLREYYGKFEYLDNEIKKEYRKNKRKDKKYLKFLREFLNIQNIDDILKTNNSGK